MRDKPGLRVKGRLARIGQHTDVGAVRLQFARVDRIGQHTPEQIIAQGGAQDRVLDREEGLHAPIQVALHQIRAAEEHLLAAPIGKVINAAVLQEASQDAAHADRLAESRNTGAQAADAAHDQIDLHAGLRGAIEGGDDFGVDQGVHFKDQLAVAILLMNRNLALDAIDNPGAQPQGRDQQFAIGALARIASQQIKERGGVGAYLRAAGQQP